MLGINKSFQFVYLRRRVLAPAMLLAFGLLTGCGVSKSTSISAGFRAVMVGSYDAPADAAGNSDPRSLTLTLSKVTLTLSDGTVVDASPTAATSYHIIGRPQIVAEKDLSAYEGKTLSAAQVTFLPTGVVGTHYGNNPTVTFGNASPKTTGTLVLQKTKVAQLEIDAQWRNTVTRDDDAKTESATAPAFALYLTLE